MNEEDLELLLLSNNPIVVDNISIPSISISDISLFGYNNYYEFLKYFCITKNQISNIVDNYEIEITNDLLFDFVFYNIQPNDKMSIENKTSTLQLQKLILRGMSFIFKENIIIEKNGFLIGENILNSSNFYKIQDVIKKRNNIRESMNDEDENPLNEKAKQLLLKQKKARQKLHNSKSQNDEGFILSDLVSILAGGMQLPLQTVYEYNLYQFNDQFNRLSIFKEYEVNIQALLHGAESNKIELKHYISKIK